MIHHYILITNQTDNVLSVTGAQSNIITFVLFQLGCIEFLPQTWTDSWGSSLDCHTGRTLWKLYRHHFKKGSLNLQDEAQKFIPEIWRLL